MNIRHPLLPFICPLLPLPYFFFPTFLPVSYFPLFLPSFPISNSYPLTAIATIYLSLSYYTPCKPPSTTATTRFYFVLHNSFRDCSLSKRVSPLPIQPLYVFIPPSPLSHISFSYSYYPFPPSTISPDSKNVDTVPYHTIPSPPPFFFLPSRKRVLDLPSTFLTPLTYFFFSLLIPTPTTFDKLPRRPWPIPFSPSLLSAHNTRIPPVLVSLLSSYSSPPPPLTCFHPPFSLFLPLFPSKSRFIFSLFLPSPFLLLSEVHKRRESSSFVYVCVCVVVFSLLLLGINLSTLLSLTHAYLLTLPSFHIQLF